MADDNGFGGDNGFGASIEANGGPGNSGAGIGGGNGIGGASGQGIGTDNSGGSGLSSSFGAGGATVDLGANGTSPSIGDTMQFSTADAMQLAGTAVTIAGLTLGLVRAGAPLQNTMILAGATTTALNSGPTSIALSHLSHDLGQIATTVGQAVANDPLGLGISAFTADSSPLSSIDVANAGAAAGSALWEVNNPAAFAPSSDFGGSQ